MSRHTHDELPPGVAFEVAQLAPTGCDIRRLWRDEPLHVIAAIYAVQELTIRTLIVCAACCDFTQPLRSDP